MDAQTVQRIRAEAARGVRHASIAKRYRVSMSTVSAVLHGVTHRHVAEPSATDEAELFRDFPSAEFYERVEKCRSGVSEISFQLRNIGEPPQHWESDIRNLGTSADRLAEAIDSTLNRFSELLDSENSESRKSRKTKRTKRQTQNS